MTDDLNGAGEVTRARGRPRKGKETQADALLDAALAAFAEHGFASASLRGIAAAAGVDVALIAYRHGSKLSLWRAVIDYFADEVLASLGAMAESPPEQSTGQHLTQAVERLIDVACDRPAFAHVLMRGVGGSNHDERLEYIHERLVYPMRDILVPIIEKAQGKSGDRPDPTFVFFILIGAISSTVTMRRFVTRSASVVTDEARFRREMKQVLLALVGQGNSPPSRDVQN